MIKLYQVTTFEEKITIIFVPSLKGGWTMHLPGHVRDLGDMWRCTTKMDKSKSIGNLIMSANNLPKVVQCLTVDSHTQTIAMLKLIVDIAKTIIAILIVPNGKNLENLPNNTNPPRPARSMSQPHRSALGNLSSKGWSHS
uniref:Uncharacterized protein n=1 Tax=Cannabis sativa TaxID=3483 RepID=A0A803P237_CANSA